MKIRSQGWGPNPTGLEEEEISGVREHREKVM